MSNIVEFQVYTFNPATQKKPTLERYNIDVKKHKVIMVLDALIHIKERYNRSLAFRRSCREGICGSCAVNVNGLNTLACLINIKPDKNNVVKILPLPHYYIIKDLVPNITSFYKQFQDAKLWLNPFHNDVDNTKQSIHDRKALDDKYECVLCASCSSSCPSYWWNTDIFYGPAILLQIARFVGDSRDDSLDRLVDLASVPATFDRCHGILNCTLTCPKHLNPARAIQGIRVAVSHL